MELIDGRSGDDMLSLKMLKMSLDRERGNGCDVMCA